jgi:hypothetical protein
MDVAVTVMMMMRARLFDFNTTHTTASSVVGRRRIGGQSRRGNRFPFLVIVSVNGVVAVVFAGGIR